MVNIHTTRDTGSLVVWPVSASSSGSDFTLEVTHDMNLVSSSFPVYKINNPNNLSEYLVLQYYSGSDIPTASGQYTYDLKETLASVPTGSFTYGGTSQRWVQAKFTWGGQSSNVLPETIDTGRAFVYGTNDPSFTKYQSSNEEGEYITYYTG